MVAFKADRSGHLQIYEISNLTCSAVARPIVHRAGGMLLQSKKELMICADLRPEDVFFYYTTTLVLLFSGHGETTKKYCQRVDDVV
jgi:hypothetical protein